MTLLYYFTSLMLDKLSYLAMSIYNLSTGAFSSVVHFHFEAVASIQVKLCHYTDSMHSYIAMLSDQVKVPRIVIFDHL